MDKKHFMVDIETLSTAVNSVVLSIGAVEFDVVSGVILNEFYHELRLQDQTHRKIDVGTVQWWFKQVMEEGLPTPIYNHADKVPVRNALILLRDFLGEEKKCIWACDPDFDCVILSNLYEEYKLFTPWKFSEPKSVRTVRELAKIHGIGLPEFEKSHNALDDCKRQVAEIVEFNRVIKQYKGA